jgi:hypothetical protein
MVPARRSVFRRHEPAKAFPRTEILAMIVSFATCWRTPTSTVPLLLEPDLDLVGYRRPPWPTETTAVSVHGTDDQPASRPCNHRRIYIEEDKHP